MQVPLKTKTFVLKSKEYFWNLIMLKKEKNEKALQPKQTEILFPMVFWILHCVINEKKDIYTPHQLYNTKYIMWKNQKIPLKPAYLFLFFKDNLVNLLNPHWIVRRATGNSNFYGIFCNKFFKRKKLRVLFFFFIWVKCERFWENYWVSHRNMIINLSRRQLQGGFYLSIWSFAWK